MEKGGIGALMLSVDAGRKLRVAMIQVGSSYKGEGSGCPQGGN